jgi:predicted Zn-dependent protease
MGNSDDAAAMTLAEVIKREPFFADPYLELGLVRERLGDRPRALASFREYVKRAPRRDAAKMQLAQQRIAALGN